MKIDGADLTGMKIGGADVTDAKLNGVAVWPTTPLSLYQRMIARADVLTATHFKTVALNQTDKYRAQPSGTQIGTLVAEYIRTATAANDIVPLVRSLDTTDSQHLRLRQFTGTNTNGTTVAASRFASWTNYASSNRSAGEKVCVMDVTDREWVSLSTRGRNSGAIGGSFINWNFGTLPASLRSSFADLAAIRAWIQTLRTAVSHEFVVVLIKNNNFTPTF